MKALFASALALSLAATVAPVSAQTYSTPDRYGPTAYGAQSDYARVIRVDPVYDNRNYDNRYGDARSGQRCYENNTYVQGEVYRDQYGRTVYPDDRYGNGGYARQGTQGGSTAATVVGGIVGAVIGSQVGGGSARYATSAIGSMVGGMAGRQIYDQSHRGPDRTGTVRVCDPVPADGRYYPSNNRVDAYDVTYEYAGRRYTSRMNYNPGDRVRVRVDVRPE